MPEFKTLQIQIHPISQKQARVSLLKTCLPPSGLSRANEQETHWDGTLDKFKPWFTWRLQMGTFQSFLFSLVFPFLRHCTLTRSWSWPALPSVSEWCLNKALSLPFWIQSHVSNFWTQEPSSGNNFCKRRRDVCGHCCGPSANASSSVRLRFDSGNRVYPPFPVKLSTVSSVSGKKLRTVFKMSVWHRKVGGDGEAQLK